MLLRRSTANKVCRSYAGLARRLALRSPRTVAMVAKKQRPPSFALVKRICDFLNASPAERDFLFLLAEKSRNDLKKIPADDVEKKLKCYWNSEKTTFDNSVSLDGVKIEFPSEFNQQMREKFARAIDVVMTDLHKSKDVGK